MKKLLGSIAALSLIATPAIAGDRDRDRNHRVEKVLKKHERRKGFSIDVRIGNDRYHPHYRYDRARYCRYGRDALTVRGLESRRAPVVVDGEPYRPRSLLCVRNVWHGDRVYQDLNRNGRWDRFEPRGVVRPDNMWNRRGYYDRHYSVRLR